MPSVIQIQFADKMVTFDTFLDVLAVRLAPKLKECLNDPSDVISQREAYRQFGQGNVKRWYKKGRLVPVSKRPGKVEYRLSDLRLLQQCEQDYFDV